MALSDNLKTKWLRTTVQMYCKIGLFVYPILLTCRCVIYGLILNDLEPITDFSKFGGIFAIIFANFKTEIVFSAAILVLYIVCYIVLILTIYFLRSLNSYLL